MLLFHEKRIKWRISGSPELEYYNKDEAHSTSGEKRKSELHSVFKSTISDIESSACSNSFEDTELVKVDFVKEL